MLRKPFAFIGAIGSAPVVIYGESERRPEEDGESGAEFELGLTFCLLYVSIVCSCIIGAVIPAAADAP